MRKAHLFRNWAIGIGFFILFSAAAGCSKSNNNTNNQKVNYTLSGNANGAQEVPAVTTTATGTLAGTYNSSTICIDLHHYLERSFKYSHINAFSWAGFGRGECFSFFRYYRFSNNSLRNVFGKCYIDGCPGSRPAGR